MKEMTVNKDDFKDAVKNAKELGESEGKKKVMKISKNKHSEFLFAYDSKSVATCRSVQDAIDITKFTFDQIAFLISNLNKAGYKVETYEVKA